MCGRFCLTTPPKVLQRLLPELMIDAAANEGFVPRYNIAPLQPILAVLNTPVPRLSVLRWGLIPAWARDASLASRMINARAETLADRPAFRAAYRKRRCLIFADGFYEWKKGARKAREPFYFFRQDRLPLALAGLWEQWSPGQGQGPELTATIITTVANALVAPVHARMPVILPEEAWERWLAPDTAAEADCLAPYPASGMGKHAVSSLVNNIRNDLPGCIQPATPESPGLF